MTPQGVMGVWIAIGMVTGIVAGLLLERLFAGVLVGVAAGLTLGAWLSPPAPAERQQVAVDQVPPRVHISRVEHDLEKK